MSTKAAAVKASDSGRSAAPAGDPSLLSQAFFHWLVPPLCLAFRRPLSEEEAPPLFQIFGTAKVFERSCKSSLTQLGHNKGSTGRRRLWQVVLFDLKPVAVVLGMALSFFSGLIVTVGRPASLRYAVQRIEEGDLNLSGVIVIVLLLSFVVLAEGIVTTWGKHLLTDHLGTEAFSYLTCLLVGKSASTQAGQDNPMNLLGNDVFRMMENVKWCGMLFIAVGGIGGGITMLLVVLGPSTLVGLSFAFGIMGLNVCLSRKTRAAESANLKASDRRVHLLRQTISMMTGVKFFAWESSCLAQISDARVDECFKIRRYRALQMLSVNIGRSSPVLSCLTTFLTYSVVMGEPMRPADIFAALLIFQSMRVSLITIPTNLAILQNVALSFCRIEDFLGRPDFPACEVLPDDSHALAELEAESCHPGARGFETALGVAAAGEGRAQQPSRRAFRLEDVRLTVEPGTLTAVLGAVGSGKSTLLGALLGMLPLAGAGSRARSCRSAGLVPQKPLVLNATVRDNILMGLPYEAAIFDEAVSAARLGRDLELLPHGEDTLVGERGTTLSGGQQMRLAIARTIYAQPDLLVLDDPLAALDHVVSTEVLSAVSRYVKGAPGRHRAVVMVLNQVHFIHSFDHALWLDGGKVTAQGSPTSVAAELGLKVAKDNGTVDDLHQESGEKAQQAPAGVTSLEQVHLNLDSTPAVKAAPVNGEKPAGAQRDERRKQGIVSSSVYCMFVRAMGPLLTLICFLSFTVSYVAMACGDRWLAFWIEQESGVGGSDGPLYPCVYLVLVLLHIATMNGGSLLCAEAGMRASNTLHLDCLVRVLKAPMSWFDDTPSGRILSRFSSDLSTVDLQLTLNLDNTVQMFLSVIAMLLVIILLVPVALVVAAVGVVLFYYEAVAVDRMNREVKRMRDTAMAPVQTNLNEVLGFGPLLQVDARDGHLRKFFLERHFKFADGWNRWSFVSNSLLNFGQLLTYYISFVIVLAATSLIIGMGNMEPATSGLAFTYCFMMPYFLGIVSQLLLMTNHSFTSLERLLELRSDSVPIEAWPLGYAFEEQLGKQVFGSAAGARIDFEGVDLRYRPGLPLAVKELSLSISPGEHLGIVGRTGSGKSSMFVLLFRLVEPAGGTILIDGTDIAKVGLHALRSSIGMIPQNPVLMSGTVRQNLDPFGDLAGQDAELLAALREAELPGLALDTQVGAGGSGLSAGECQLLSFARCLLRCTRLVVLDEPTASVDFETDRKVQALVRSAFEGRTLLCIAHRLHSVIDFDRILVMDAGRRAALGAPTELLADPGSALSRIVDGGAKGPAKETATPCCSFSAGARRLVSSRLLGAPAGGDVPPSALRRELTQILQESNRHHAAVGKWVC